MSTKKALLAKLRVGHRVAEDEKHELAQYFVRTSQWTKLENGEIDIVYGAKGTGKSALYSLLMNSADSFADKNVLLIPAENPLGASAFQGLIDESAENSETNLSYVWKLYILQIISSKLRDLPDTSEIADRLVIALETAGLLPKKVTLSSLFSRAKNYIQNLGSSEATDVEYTLALDQNTGFPIATRKVSYAKPDKGELLSSVPVNDLLAFANEGLGDQKKKVWVLFDRLDVAFASSAKLEKEALRALFRVYADLKPLENIQTKMFVRKDIWERITEGGFREASHIIKTDTIQWDRDSLVNLVASRLLNNQPLVEYLKIDKNEALQNLAMQEQILRRILPDKVDTGKNPDAFGWILSRVQDGTKEAAPREIIHMLECLIKVQLKKLEQGRPEPNEEILFDRSVFKESLGEVSKVRYEQTFCAENPKLKEFTELLRAGKCEQNNKTLSETWQRSQDELQAIADQLVSTGFFELRTEKDFPYWIPFVYRDALDLVQGKAA